MYGIIEVLNLCKPNPDKLHELVIHDAFCQIWRSTIILVINSYSASRDNWCTVGGNGGCRVGEVRAGTTSPMPDHKDHKDLKQLQ